MYRISAVHLLLAVILLIILLIIAFTLESGILRTWGGDVMVVMMLYFFVRAFTKIQPNKIALGVLIFAFAIEISQYFHLIRMLGLQHSFPARLVLGDTFQWTDLVAYALGVGLVWWIDRMPTRLV